jgi:hypothetical protein
MVSEGREKDSGSVAILAFSAIMRAFVMGMRQAADAAATSIRSPICLRMAPMAVSGPLSRVAQVDSGGGLGNVNEGLSGSGKWNDFRGVQELPLRFLLCCHAIDHRIFIFIFDQCAGRVILPDLLPGAIDVTFLGVNMAIVPPIVLPPKIRFPSMAS